MVSRRNEFDLDNRALEFTSGYRFAVSAAGYDNAAATSGEALASLGDDDSQETLIGFSFPYYGRRWQSVWINSDGNLTFGSGDSASASRSVGRMTSGPPRIAPLFMDLDPSRGGSVRVLRESSRLVVSWVGVPEFSDFGAAPRNTFQVALHSDGRITYAWSGVTTTEAVVGIAPGELAGETRLLSFSEGSSDAFTGAVVERFGGTEEIDVVVAAQKFFAAHEDAYDFLAIFNTLGIPAASGAVAYELTVRGTATGNGDVMVDRGAEYGSAKRLKAVLNLGPLSQYPVDPNARVPARFSTGDTPLSVIGHEAGHLFLAYASVREPNDASARPMLGRQTAHWAFTFNSEASLLEGNRIEDRGPEVSPRFRTIATVEGFSPLDQYLMGLRAPSEVPPTFLVTNSVFSNFNLGPQVGVSMNGSRRDVHIDELVAAEGPRIPDHTVAQRRFRFAFLLIVPEGTTPTEEQIRQVDNYRAQFETYFGRVTDERAKAATTLVRALDFSMDPAAGMLAGETRSARLRLARPTERPLLFRVSAEPGFVEAPEQVEIAKGQKDAEFPLRARATGVATVRVTSEDPAYESAEARIQVLPDTGAFQPWLVTGARQRAIPGQALTVRVRAADANRLPYAGRKITARVIAGGSVMPAEATTRADGEAEFRYTPEDAPQNRVEFRTENGRAVTFYGLGAPFATVESIRNAASFAPGLAPGSLFTIFGVNLATREDAAAPRVPLPTELGGAQVLINGQRAPILYAGYGQINAQVPEGFEGSSAQVEVVTAIGRNAPVTVPVETAAPGIFAAVGRTGYVEVYATGSGRVELRTDDLRWAVAKVEALVDGQPGEVLFAGRAPGFQGLDQVNVRIPAGAATVQLRVNGKLSNAVKIATP